MNFKSPVFNRRAHPAGYGVEERCWVYHMYYGSWTGGSYFDAEYGVRFDLSDEEILSLTIERLQKKKFSDHTIGHTDDKWLSDEYIVRKK